jgi:hypothetical protein
VLSKHDPGTKPLLVKKNMSPLAELRWGDPLDITRWTWTIGDVDGPGLLLTTRSKKEEGPLAEMQPRLLFAGGLYRTFS